MFYEVKAIARAKIKTDKRDSEVLAHLLRMNMIPEVYRRSTENRQAQRVLRQRAFYVSAMTALKNRVHAFLAQQREEIREEVARETNIFSEKGQKVLLGLDLAPREKKLLEALLKTYRHLETRIGESFPRFTVPAIRPITAKSFGQEIAGCGGRRWRRSGRGSGRILTCAAFTNGWPAAKARTRPKWPQPGDF